MRELSKLVNIGAMPQASYGKEAGSITLRAIHKMRSMAAIAVGTSTRGQRTTTRIWLSLGIHSDPWVKCLVDQVKTWLWLYSCSLLPHNVLDPKLCKGAIVHRNWDIAKAKILGSGEPLGYLPHQKNPHIFIEGRERTLGSLAQAL